MYNSNSRVISVPLALIDCPQGGRLLVRSPAARTDSWLESSSSSGWSPPWDPWNGLLPISAQALTPGPEGDAARGRPGRQSRLILVPAAVVVFLMVSSIVASLLFGSLLGSRAAMPIETSESGAEAVTGGTHVNTLDARLLSTTEDNAQENGTSWVIGDPEPWRRRSRARGPS
ncbi:uncharacterized protein LOC142583616 [Dermacentor variabilis]|uniref:uncharacterized protein LOC142583616 n=1 Tax=Dermacentor variabilis TaxID=34621 RepID=UPI003F5C1C9A